MQSELLSKLDNLDHYVQSMTEAVCAIPAVKPVAKPAVSVDDIASVDTRSKGARKEPDVLEHRSNVAIFSIPA